MFPPRQKTLSLICTTIAALAVIPSLGAQGAGEVTISKVEPQIVNTPAISYSGATQKATRPKNWLEVEVSFTWQPRSATDKYTDDLTVNYYVYLNNKSALYPQGALLTGQTALTSVQARQNDLKTVVYVSGKALDRLFDGKAPTSATTAVTDIGVTISKGGQVVAEKSLHGNGAWWSQLQQVPGYLLAKQDTPFAPLNWDYYEQVKKP